MREGGRREGRREAGREGGREGCNGACCWLLVVVSECACSVQHGTPTKSLPLGSVRFPPLPRPDCHKACGTSHAACRVESTAEMWLPTTSITFSSSYLAVSFSFAVLTVHQPCVPSCHVMSCHAGPSPATLCSSQLVLIATNHHTSFPSFAAVASEGVHHVSAGELAAGELQCTNESTCECRLDF